MVLAFIPFLAYPGCLLYLINQSKASGLDGSSMLRQEALHAWIVWGIYLVLSMEALSLFKAVTPFGLLVAWLLPVFAFGLWWLHRRHAGVHLKTLALGWPSGRINWILAAQVVLVLAVSLVVAWLAPPQNWDVFTYHLSRVAHWAQNQSIHHYVTGIERQNSMSPGAELQVLLFYVLAGGDRLANLPSWLALSGNALAVSLAAAYLGARQQGQWMAAVFAVTLPMAVIQASSASTDNIASFWVVCAVVELLAYLRTQRQSELLYLALAAGLAVLTKPTVLPYLLPFAAWTGLLLLHRMGFKHTLRWGALAVLLVVLVNAGYVGRNWLTYGNISNPADFAVHSNQNRSLMGITSTLLKNLMTHAGLPRQAWYNLQLFRLIAGWHYKVNLDINDPRTTADGEYRIFDAPLNQEDRATNPFHAYLAVGLFGLSLFWAKKLPGDVLIYGLVTALTMLIFSAFFKWNAFGMRYHLPFFVLLAPAAGVILDQFRWGWLSALLAAGLFFTSSPAYVNISARPLVILPGFPHSPTLLTEARRYLYFVAAGEPKPYEYMLNIIKSRSCKQVGLALLGGDPEYLLWMLLGAPDSDLRIEWIVTGPSSRYASPDFKPCGVICHDCPPEKKTFNDLLRYEGPVLYPLYLAP